LFSTTSSCVRPLGMTAERKVYWWLWKKKTLWISGFCKNSEFARKVYSLCTSGPCVRTNNNVYGSQLLCKNTEFARKVYSLCTSGPCVRTNNNVYGSQLLCKNTEFAKREYVPEVRVMLDACSTVKIWETKNMSNFNCRQILI
jgi:hypothetical protein